MAYQLIEGNEKASNVKVGIVLARWNSMINDRMLDGALKALKGNGIKEEDITVVKCPGAFEIPLTAQWLVDTGSYDGILTLGTVIRGGTPHFEYVCDAVTSGVLEVNLKSNIPVVFGVLTTDDVKQAMDRSGEDGNKGAEAALALVEMISLKRNINP